MMAGSIGNVLGRYFLHDPLLAERSDPAGEAGAPLLNMKGEVVGTSFSGLGNNSACYACAHRSAGENSQRLCSFREARHGWIGVKVLSPRRNKFDDREQGAQVGGMPDRHGAGLKEGDVLLQVGKKKSTRGCVRRLVLHQHAATPSRLQYTVGNQKMTFQGASETMHPSQQDWHVTRSSWHNSWLSPMSLDDDAPPSRKSEVVCCR
jgi:hypothetical protein